MAATVTGNSKRAEKDRDEWLKLIDQLAHQVESWANDRHWAVRRESRQIEESRLGSYSAPVVDIMTPAGRMYLEPVARDVAKAEGRVDLVAWPSLNRMLLVGVGDKWKLKTDSGADRPDRWSQRTFEKLAELLHAAT